MKIDEMLETEDSEMRILAITTLISLADNVEELRRIRVDFIDHNISYQILSQPERISLRREIMAKEDKVRQNDIRQREQTMPDGQFSGSGDENPRFDSSNTRDER